MKLFDPIKKEVFLNINDAMVRFCMAHHSCDACPLNSVTSYGNCTVFCKQNPSEAAKIMGYTILENGTNAEKRMSSEQEQPSACKGIGRFCSMLCEALNIEPGEEWMFHGIKYHVRPSNGLIYLRNIEEGSAWVLMENVLKLADMVDHPENIVRLSQWTEQEVERTKAIRVLYPDARRIEKGESGIKVFSDKLVLATLDTELFPNLQDGQSVELTAVIGGDHNA